MLKFDNIVHAAVFMAKAQLHSPSQARQERLYDLIEGSNSPNLVLAYVAKRLGRHKALAVGIDRGVIEKAIRAFRDGDLA